MAVLTTAPFSLSAVKYARTCLSKSWPSISGRPIFFFPSAVTVVSSPARFRAASSLRYFVIHVRTLLSFSERCGNFFEK
jgi:hypothetical protein